MHHPPSSATAGTLKRCSDNFVLRAIQHRFRRFLDLCLFEYRGMKINLSGVHTEDLFVGLSM